MLMALKEMFIITEEVNFEEFKKWEKIMAIAKEKEVIVSIINLSERGSKKEKSYIEDKFGVEVHYTSFHFLQETLLKAVEESVKSVLTNIVEESIKYITNKNFRRLHPYIRKQIIEYIEKLSRNINLKLVILLDIKEADKKYINGKIIHKRLTKKGKKIDLYITYKMPLEDLQFEEIDSFFEAQGNSIKNMIGV
ncbi:MAG TPA: hypothetical protein GXX15_11545 [Clostridia bacterium]|nr:hypothetical protein [Clostridia bacterium]